MGVSIVPGGEEDLAQLRVKLHKEGKLVLFNPSPFGPFQCPKCWSKLEDKPSFEKVRGKWKV